MELEQLIAKTTSPEFLQRKERCSCGRNNLHAVRAQLLRDAELKGRNADRDGGSLMGKRSESSARRIADQKSMNESSAGETREGPKWADRAKADQNDPKTRRSAPPERSGGSRNNFLRRQVNI